MHLACTPACSDDAAVAVPGQASSSRSPPVSSTPGRQTEHEAEEEAEACSICLDDFVQGEEVKTLPCLHHYHTRCVGEWLRRQGRGVECPVCKTPVFEGQL